MTQTCTQCKETKEITLFVKNNRYESGYSRLCKECKARMTREKRLKDPNAVEKARLLAKAWREKNREKANANSRNYKKRNRDKVNEYQRQYRAEHREEHNEYNKNWQRERYNEKKEVKKREYSKFKDLLFAQMDELRKEGSTCGN